MNRSENIKAALVWTVVLLMAAGAEGIATLFFDCMALLF